MTEHQPLTPPPGLVTSLRNSAPHGIRDAGVTREVWLINHAYAAGADHELLACCEWLANETPEPYIKALRAARRPKPPSLKEEGFTALELLKQRTTDPNIIEPLSRVLEALSDDQH